MIPPCGIVLKIFYLRKGVFYMPELKTYDLFISHAWKYGDDYTRLINLLNEASNFKYRNYSAPEDNPLVNLNGTPVTNKIQIKGAILRKIRPVNCILVISGMYYNNREWMQYEIDSSVGMNKPIIAIKPWGNTNMPTEIQKIATEIVNWNTDSIVSAIRRHSL